MPSDPRALLERLSNAFGPSGFEGPVRAIVRDALDGTAESIETDGVGSLIARHGADGPRVMLSAHMDELGLLVRRITDDGYLKFQTLGGWLDQAIVNQRWTVLTRNGPITGVTGIKTVHVMSDDARRKVFRRQDLFIDVGAADRADAEQRLGVRPGDPVAPASTFEVLSGGDLYLGKAWDDRVGVAVLVLAMEELAAAGHPNALFGVATAQEEVGLRGAGTGAYEVDPAIGINIEAGVASDYPGITEDEAQERLGEGPGIFLHDSSMLPNLKLRDFVLDVASEIDVPVQFNVLTGYGQDGSAVQRTRGGVPTINVTVPTRYLHSHHSVIHRADVERTVRLVSEVVRRLDAATVEEIRRFD